MIARKSASLAVIASMLATGLAAPVNATSPRRMPPPQREFCRVPAPLPALGAEIERDQQVQNGTVRRGRAAAGGVMAAPPAPATASSSVDRYDDSSTGDIVVSATRAEGRADSVSAPTSAVPPPPPPPPPAPPPPAPERAGDASIARTSPILPPRPYPRPRPQPQAGMLTSGEHDDLLNPELYARYVAGSNLAQTIRDLPVLDTGRVLTVRVNDSGGRPVPFANVIVTCSDGNRLSLPTQADGTVALFPGLDRLSPNITVAVQVAGQSTGQGRRVSLSSNAGAQQIGFTVARANSAPTKLDLMLVVDTTGSMGDEIAYLRSELQSIIAGLQQSHRGLDVRIGFVFYRDTSDDYVTRTVPFGRDIANAQSILSRQSANGGGDYPEAMDQALIRAVGQQWRPDAVKTMLLVADAPPHDDLMGRAWAAAESARAERIHIVPVAASGVADEAEYAMRAMAALTQSQYVFLTDDSGIGNAHAAPAIDCYRVTRLNAMLRRVIDSQLSGRRIEAPESEIIREVGNYDNGRCILPPDWQREK